MIDFNIYSRHNWGMSFDVNLEDCLDSPPKNGCYDCGSFLSIMGSFYGHLTNQLSSVHNLEFGVCFKNPYKGVFLRCTTFPEWCPIITQGKDIVDGKLRIEGPI